MLNPILPSFSQPIVSSSGAMSMEWQNFFRDLLIQISTPVVDGDHTQGTDTTLGAQIEDIDMNNHQITSLSVPSISGAAIRRTTKITEVALEAIIDAGGGGIAFQTAAVLGTL